MSEITYNIRPTISSDALNVLFASAWEHHEARDFGSVLVRSFTYVCAFDGSRLIGFVNVVWDGGRHGFILDTTVHCDYQRQGIGTQLMKLAAEEAAKQDLEWLHVDFDPHLITFYRKCGYRHTEAGLLNLWQHNMQAKA